MTIDELKNSFSKIKDEDNIPEIFSFLKKLTEENSKERMEYHYSLLSMKVKSDTLFNLLRRKFNDYKEVGEVYLLDKFDSENDYLLKGQILHLLGSYRNSKYSDRTREKVLASLKSEDDFLREKAVIVLGWVGYKTDICSLNKILTKENNLRIRGWAASAMMQLYFTYQDDDLWKNEMLRYLKDALKSEENDFVLSCILVAIQEITEIKLGLSPTSHNTPSSNKLLIAKKKALSNILKEESCE